MKNYNQLLRCCSVLLFVLALFLPMAHGQQNCDIPPGNQGCDDGNACTIDLKDGAGNCFHIVLNCDDGNPLTKDSCNPATGQCENTPLVCDDDDPSTEDVIDLEGNCRHFKKVCDDGDPQTRDYFDADGKCISERIACDDGDPDTEDYLDDDGSCHHVKTIVTVVNECDECPDDPNKTTPGACGCGTPDTDTDGDGTPDCDDWCPNDPNKTEMGNCGCGNPEPGTPCNDGDDCTADDRINENCECAGVPKDTPECRNETCVQEIGSPCDDGNPCTVNDEINEDCECKGRLKDSDGDGTPDCDDWCPNDPNKTEMGACGCGTPDTDTDGDGTPDCDDWCPNDPNKTEMGNCGCGNPEPGTPCNDGDDCTTDDRINENCECAGVPKDTPECRNETCVQEIGSPCDDGDPCTVDDEINEDCECKGRLKDSDGDGTPDCDDWCPNDPNKTEDGQCGCGHPDTDSDGDGTPDCNDWCPNDPDKTEDGQCGCGNPEPGTPCNDGDDCTADDRINENCECAGVPKDTPECRNETCLQEIGEPCDDGNACTVNDQITEDCECKGTVKDTDHDGTPDCDDWCPNDPNKTEMGACGCGTPDTDTDHDGAPDCEDWCPNDPNKTEMGNCGCGNPEPGMPCDDNDDCTTDDRINENCECAGIPKDTPECRNETCVQEIGEPCDDGNACTFDDKINADCECEGTIQDSDHDGTPDCDDICPDDPNDLCLECPNDLEGCDGYINFVSCDKVIICLGKDISNIVVDLGPTGFQNYNIDTKFDNLSGQRWTYMAPEGATINGIWVKTAAFCGKCTDDEELYGCVDCEGDACPKGNGAGPYYLNDKRCEGEDIHSSDQIVCEDPTDTDGDGTPNCRDFCPEDPADQCTQCTEELAGCEVSTSFPACDKVVVCTGETIQHIVVDLGPSGFQRFSIDRKFSGIHDTHWAYQAPYGQPIHGVWVKTKGDCPSCGDNEAYGCTDGEGSACPNGNIGGRYYRNVTSDCTQTPAERTTEEARIELNLFPNPTSRELFVNIENAANRSGSVQVLSTQGDAVYHMTIEALREDNMKINLGNQPAGLYFLRVILDNGEVLTKQFVLAE